VNSAGEDAFVKVYDESERDIQQFHVAEQFCFVDGNHSFNCLQFEEEAIVDKNIVAQGFFKGQIFVSDTNHLLLGDFKATLRQFMHKVLLVNGFDETRTFVSVNFDGSSNYLAGDSVCPWE